MVVKVRSIAQVRQLLGQPELEIAVPEGATVEDLMACLADLGGPQLAAIIAEPKEASAHAPCRIMVNGRDIGVLEGRSTVLADGDDVLVFVPIAGG
jgi:molybdopterin converting factor small subunit